MREHYFPESNIVGKSGEEVVKEYLETFAGIDHYEDVSDKPAYRKRDIDGILHTTKGRQIEVEIKTDTYDTGNLFYETISNVKYNTPGCMEKTEASYIYYYFQTTGELYVLPMPATRNWVHDNASRFKVQPVFNRDPNTNKTSYSTGYLIRKSVLEAECPGVRKFQMHAPRKIA